MQHMPATIEEQLTLKSIKEECPWENLPKRLQATLSSKEEWHRRIIDHCIKKRLHWNACFARKVCKEGEYYEEMMRYLRKNLALFPYRLAEYVSRVMRISPFRYYCDMIFEVMRNEQPYDSIPNFSAADALRITGIGRNEFIDIMNKCRSKKIMWKLNKSIAKELLPTQPVDFVIEPWWGVCLVNFTLEEFKKLTEEEMSTIDKVCKEEANSFVLFDPDIVRGLYKRGLIYFDVPVYPDDRFKVSRLEGFVSNREQSYEDPIEELLYAVFVVSSENSTVAELASTLQADLSQLQAAASFACRLGWAVKMIDPASVLRDSNASSGIALALSDEEDSSSTGTSTTNTFSAGGISGLENNLSHSGFSRLAFIVDANITSYLMMGSISPGLKSHAVTLYEAGKLGDASIADLCKDLATLEGKRFEGELQEFANHAYSLRCVLECLQSGGASAVDQKNLDETSEQLSLDVDISGPGENLSNGEEFNAQKLEATMMEDNILDPVNHMDDTDGSIPIISSSGSIYSDVNSVPELVVGLDKGTEEKVDMQGEKEYVLSLETPHNTLKKKKTYLVNILRCESLAALSTATLKRLFLRDYDVVLSMVPLPSSSVLPGTAGPVHFGPPSYAAMTPWMKLALYTTLSSGPLSIVLMKGQCLRILPAPLAGCEKALLWSWDGSVTGGLGGKFEGNLVSGNILLHCLNSMLRSSAVLVQPLCKEDLNDSGKVVTIDIPLPLKNFDGSVVNIGEGSGLCREENAKLNSLLRELSERIELSTIGYIRLLKLLKDIETDCIHPDTDKYQWVPLSVEFGIPLFSPKLCSQICERVISSRLLQADSFEGHHNGMQNLRKKLRDICLEYQATGSTAKLFYYREQPKESPRQLTNYASGRWSPFSEPSTPISDTSNELRRLKFANRQQFRTEVLSFDGNILRSYALTPVYEAATRIIEESSSTSSVKPESDESDSREVVLPGINLLFDGSVLHPFDIGACLQGRQPILLIAEASASSAAMQVPSTLKHSITAKNISFCSRISGRCDYSTCHQTG